MCLPKKIISTIIQVPVLLEPKSNHSLNSNPIHLFGSICTLLFYIIFSLTSFGPVWAIIRQLQFKGFYKVYEYTFSLKSDHQVYQNPLLDPCLNHPFQYKPYVYTLSLRPCLILLCYISSLPEYSVALEFSCKHSLVTLALETVWHMLLYVYVLC